MTTNSNIRRLNSQLFVNGANSTATETDKFSSINKLFSTIEINLPDVSFSTNGIDIDISELTCTNLNVDDVELVSNDRSMNVDVSGIKLDCTFNWVYNWFFSGSGTGVANTEPTSSIGISVDFISDDSTASPYPFGVEISKCETNLQIDQMKFNGGLAGGIANLVQSSVQESIENELAKLVCNEISKLDDDNGTFDDMLGMIEERIDSMMLVQQGEDATSQSVDPLHAEMSAVVPTDADGHSQWMDFHELEILIQDFIGMDIEQLVSKFVGGENASSINFMMHDTLLNENGVSELDPISIFDQLTFFEVDDQFTQTTLRIKSITVKGLDTLDGTNLLNPIG